VESWETETAIKVKARDGGNAGSNSSAARRFERPELKVLTWEAREERLGTSSRSLK
jgi:hypothetical protein